MEKAHQTCWEKPISTTRAEPALTLPKQELSAVPASLQSHSGYRAERDPAKRFLGGSGKEGLKHDREVRPCRKYTRAWGDVGVALSLS